MSRALVFLLICLQISPLIAQKTKSQKAFTKAYAEALEKVNPSVNYRILGKLIIEGKKGDKEIIHKLNNVYKEYKLVPESYEELMNRYLRASALLYIEQEKIQVDHIIPVIKHRSYLAYIEQLKGEQSGKQELLYESYNDELVIVYAEDKKRSISYLEKSSFEKLGIARDTLLSFAIKNLENILPEINRSGGNGRYMLTAGGDYELSLILLDRLWKPETLPVDGEYVIAIPNRDLLFITGSNNQEFIQELRKICKDSFENGTHPISRDLYIWNGNSFVLLHE